MLTFNLIKKNNNKNNHTTMNSLLSTISLPSASNMLKAILKPACGSRRQKKDVIWGTSIHPRASILFVLNKRGELPEDKLTCQNAKQKQILCVSDDTWKTVHKHFFLSLSSNIPEPAFKIYFTIKCHFKLGVLSSFTLIRSKRILFFTLVWCSLCTNRDVKT